jgi:hypothetical protein
VPRRAGREAVVPARHGVTPLLSSSVRGLGVVRGEEDNAPETSAAGVIFTAPMAF